ncbi:hypothetical protein ACFW04_014695 [Cataglyphis niger]
MWRIGVIYNAGVPFERVQLDVVGPFPTSSSENKYLLVISNYFTKWVEAFPLKNVRTKTVAETFVNQIISRFGVPSEVHTDQEEILIRDCSGNCRISWALKKQKRLRFILTYRSARHETTGVSPAESCFGQHLKLPLDLLRGIPSESEVNLSERSFVSKLRGRLNEIHNEALGNACHLHFEPGNKVWLYNPRRISKKYRNKIVHLDRLASHHERHI